MPDWLNPQDYAFTQTLTAGQWAWEFLRRNPEYRAQWQAFITTWRALESVYGKPAQRDINAWAKQLKKNQGFLATAKAEAAKAC